MLGAFLSGYLQLVWGVLLQLVGRAGLLWRDGKVGFPSVLELSLCISVTVYQPLLQSVVLGCHSWPPDARGENKRGLCPEAATVTPCGHPQEACPVRALDTDLSTSLLRSVMAAMNACTEVGVGGGAAERPASAKAL